MRRLVLAASIVAAAGLPGLAAAEPFRTAPPPRALHARNPSLSNLRPANPLQQQIQENYRSQLLQSQRELQQSKPSGLGRSQLEIGHELNNIETAPR